MRCKETERNSVDVFSTARELVCRHPQKGLPLGDLLTFLHIDIPTLITPSRGANTFAVPADGVR